MKKHVQNIEPYSILSFLLGLHLWKTQAVVTSTSSKVGAFITALDDVELWCEFPPKSESTAALTDMIDGHGKMRVCTGSPSHCFPPNPSPLLGRSEVI